ncbi:Uncharacterised protein [Vibrio cholerae]|nr:Uncharacterised protein [Vibrio cholerae]
MSRIPQIIELALGHIMSERSNDTGFMLDKVC